MSLIVAIIKQEYNKRVLYCPGEPEFLMLNTTNCEKLIEELNNNHMLTIGADRKELRVHPEHIDTYWGLRVIISDKLKNHEILVR